MPAHRGSPRGRRPSTSATAAEAAAQLRWIPVGTLSALARALLSDDLGGRDVVPQHVAARVNRDATRWAAHGFTAETVRPWMDLPPAAAAYLVERGVAPRVLVLPVMVSRSPVTLTLAISSGMIPVERAYQLLVATGEHRVAGAEPPSAEPDRGDRPSPPPRRPVAQVIFSHAPGDRREAVSDR